VFFNFQICQFHFQEPERSPHLSGTGKLKCTDRNLTKSRTRTCLAQMIRWKQEFENSTWRKDSDFWNHEMEAAVVTLKLALALCLVRPPYMPAMRNASWSPKRSRPGRVRTKDRGLLWLRPFWKADKDPEQAIGVHPPREPLPFPIALGVPYWKYIVATLKCSTLSVVHAFFEQIDIKMVAVLSRLRLSLFRLIDNALWLHKK